MKRMMFPGINMRAGSQYWIITCYLLVALTLNACIHKQQTASSSDLDTNHRSFIPSGQVDQSEQVNQIVKNSSSSDLDTNDRSFIPLEQVDQSEQVNQIVKNSFSSDLDINDHSFIPSGQVDQIIRHSFYSLGYSEEHKQALWVAYELSKKDVLEGLLKRTDNFKPDNKVKGPRAELSDYKGSGYDRGHLAPARDMAFNKTAMNESFLLTNISPQEPSFNRGIWKKLEKLLRDWAVQYNDIYVITGNIQENRHKEIGRGVSVPADLYKVVYSHARQEMIAWVIPNKKSNAPLEDFAVSVDEVERLTSLDFFEKLDDDIENLLERSINIHKWKW